jgi:hypothetical protein
MLYETSFQTRALMQRIMLPRERSPKGRTADSDHEGKCLSSVMKPLLESCWIPRGRNMTGSLFVSSDLMVTSTAGRGRHLAKKSRALLRSAPPNSIVTTCPTGKWASNTSSVAQTGILFGDSLACSQETATHVAIRWFLQPVRRCRGGDLRQGDVCVTSP